MINRKIAATISLGLFVFGFIFEIIVKDHKSLQHEPAKIPIVYSYSLNPISASGTASTVSGPITFTKV